MVYAGPGTSGSRGSSSSSQAFGTSSSSPGSRTSNGGSQGPDDAASGPMVSSYTPSALPTPQSRQQQQQWQRFNDLRTSSSTADGAASSSSSLLLLTLSSLSRTHTFMSRCRVTALQAAAAQPTSRMQICRVHSSSASACRAGAGSRLMWP